MTQRLFHCVSLQLHHQFLKNLKKVRIYTYWMFSHQYDGPYVHSFRPSKWGVAPQSPTTTENNENVKLLLGRIGYWKPRELSKVYIGDTPSELTVRCLLVIGVIVNYSAKRKTKKLRFDSSTKFLPFVENSPDRAAIARIKPPGRCILGSLCYALNRNTLTALGHGLNRIERRYELLKTLLFVYF